MRTEMTMREVTLKLRVDTKFLSRLNANVRLSGLRNKALDDHIQPIDQVALAVWAEACGAPEDQIMECIADQNRANFGIVMDGREVRDLTEEEAALR